MTRKYIAQTNFTAGELDPRLHGRTDLRAYQNGAAKLRNVFVDPTGGVRRRPGLRRVATVAGPGRLVALEVGPDRAFLIVFSDLLVQVFEGDLLQASIPAPWSSADLAQIAWAQLNDRLVVVHPDVAPQVVWGDGGSWGIDPLSFLDKGAEITCAPFARYADAGVEIQASGTTGSITIVTTAPAFGADHLGTILRIQGKHLRLTSIQSATQAAAILLPDQSLDDTDPTVDWDELAFSGAHGWPVAVTFHQDRMVFAGTRDLPNGLWMSRTGQPTNFDLGSGLDDEGIAFRLASNDVQAVRALVSGRHLQVFTSTGEWIVTGDPLTPTRIQVVQQSRVGSPRDRYVPPRDVDGATLFAARSGHEIREYLFSDTEQAYQTADLALLAGHLVNDPVDQVFDRRRRQFLVAMADGTLAAIGLYRDADVAAWTLIETQGRILSIGALGDDIYFLVDRDGVMLLERLDDTLDVDAGVAISASDPVLVVDGLDHLEGREVALASGSGTTERKTVAGGLVVVDTPSRMFKAGLPYSHEIEPLPPVTGGGPDARYRPIRITLRVFETQSVRLDAGAGLQDLPLHRVGAGPCDRGPVPFTGDLSTRALGWRRGTATPTWRIRQDTPFPATILSVTTEVKVND